VLRVILGNLLDVGQQAGSKMLRLNRRSRNDERTDISGVEKYFEDVLPVDLHRIERD
jgi:hypothetical protein